MEINKNKVVQLIYTLIVDGEVADQTTPENPLEFIFGTGSLLPKFEENILGKKEGDNYQFKLSAADGYGVFEKEAVVELPKEIFKIDGELREDLLVIGKTIPMKNSMGGVMMGKVTEIKSDFVVMDFNHPLAGKELNFSGTILTVREASEKEILEGLHGELVEHNCGGSCSSCGGCH